MCTNRLTDSLALVGRQGHVAALKYLFGSSGGYCDPINLGTGVGTSVYGMIAVRSLPGTRPDHDLMVLAVCWQHALVLTGSYPQKAFSGAAQAFDKASGKKCNYKVVPRRAGDAGAVWGATEKAERVRP